MKSPYWLLVLLFLGGLGLFLSGLYLTYWSEERGLGFQLLMGGIAVWFVLLVVGLFFSARVRIKILKDSSEYQSQKR